MEIKRTWQMFKQYFLVIDLKISIIGKQIKKFSFKFPTDFSYSHVYGRNCLSVPDRMNMPDRNIRYMYFFLKWHLSLS